MINKFKRLLKIGYFRVAYLLGFEITIVSKAPPYRIFSLIPGRDEIAIRLLEKGSVNQNAIRNLCALNSEHLNSSSSPDRLYVIEVGAHIGSNTINLIDSGFNVVAFEPDPRNFQLLKKNITTNNLTQFCTIKNVALGSDRNFKMLIRTRSSAQNTFSALDSSHYKKYKTLDRISVMTETLDECSLFVPNVNQIAFTWIWSQGYEAQILKGASKFLALKIPLVILVYPDLLSDENLSFMVNILFKTYSFFVPIAFSTDLISTIELESFVEELKKSNQWRFLYFI